MIPRPGPDLIDVVMARRLPLGALAVSASSMPSPLRLIKEDRMFVRYRVARPAGSISRLG
jgi:hypothetical protein